MRTNSIFKKPSERTGFVLLATLIVGLIWSLHSSASRTDNSRDRGTATAAYSATLLLNNKGPDPLTASPTLFNMAGDRFNVPPVTIDGQSFQMIDMSPWINSAGPQFQEGSIEVFHLGKDLVLGAQVYLVDEQHSLSFDEKLVETKTFKSTRLEGLWWLPSQKGQVLLAVSNNSDSAVSATVNADGQTPQRAGQQIVTLAAHETRVLDVQSDVIQHADGAMSRFGSISVTYSGSPGAVFARGMAQDSSVGYSLAIQFSDPAAAKSSQLQGVGLRLGSAGGEALDPLVVVRNVSNSRTTVTGRVSYTDPSGATNIIPLADLNLAAAETAIVDLDKLLQQRGHEQPDAIGGLELEYSTEKGSVIASALSVSMSGNQVFRVPIWDIYGLRSSTGGYPWSIDGNSSTMVYIKNSADHQQHFFMNVKFDGGDYQIGRKTIEAGQTVVYDLRKLRDDQVPDIHGKKLPVSAMGGQVHWTKTGTEDGVLIGRSEQADTVLGVSSNYACVNCCDDSARNGRIEPNNATGWVGQNYTFVAMDDLQDCYGGTFPQEIYSAAWSSSNDSVASVSVGTATAWAPGTVTITASFYDDIHVVVSCDPGGPIPEFGGDCCEARTVHFTPTATFNVFDVRILRDGTDITGSTTDVVVGEQINLSMQVLPAGTSASNIQWSVPGNPAANYVANNSTGAVTIPQ